MYVCNRHLHYVTDPLLHFRPSLRSAYLSRGRENETFVASDQQRSSSHALSVGSGSRVGGDVKVREEVGVSGAQSLCSFC